MLKLLIDQSLVVVRAIAPLATFALILQLVIVRAPWLVFLQFLGSVLMVIAGMTLFLLGIKVGILPAGETIGSELPQRHSIWLIIGVVFLVAFATTVAEPDVIVLAGQTAIMSGGATGGSVLVYVLGFGVAFFAGLAILRIVLGFSMRNLLTVAFGMMILLSFFTPAGFVSLAFDSGSVTTGVLTAPIMISLGLGLSSVLAGRSAVSDGFGLLGLASIGPIIAVMLMGIIAR